ncbi:hypothetical protein GFS24_26435 [Chitinophaga sp. SYP-B3965]|uniref:DUF6134 family protein n=1 Tax=Chitinophaga sp. SYP-B3965 TaxID=2663120 RepID=UPI0013BE4CFE|nr:DUF6134 family protein [Chitinophaga sp. SYP-B3965]MRG48679.1 hypothetical protein [Chitinophaga sp. SYP-B3965]
MYKTHKQYRLKRICLVLICGIIPYLAALKAAGQSYTYEIRYANNTIGLLDVKQETSGAVRKIHIKSRISMKLLSRMETDISVEYHNTVLIKAQASRASKGADSKETSTEKTEKGYNVVRKGVPGTLSTAQITFSVSELYFGEPPKDLKEIYSETHGVFLKIKQLADKRYEVSTPDDRSIYYRYEKGKLMEVEVNHQFGKAYFRLIQAK